MTDQTEAALVHPTDAAFGDLERRERVSAFKAAWWDAQHALGAAAGGAQVDLKRSAARWAEQYEPPLLLEATVRFKRPGYARPKRRRKG